MESAIMKGPLYRSDDGQKEGTREEVEVYEASLNPLAKFKFPWRLAADGSWRNTESSFAVTDLTTLTTIELLNLMPLVEELRQAFDMCVPGWRTKDFNDRWVRSVRNLLLAYEKALGIEMKS